MGTFSAIAHPTALPVVDPPPMEPGYRRVDLYVDVPAEWADRIEAGGATIVVGIDQPQTRETRYTVEPHEGDRSNVVAIIDEGNGKYFMRDPNGARCEIREAIYEWASLTGGIGSLTVETLHGQTRRWALDLT